MISRMIARRRYAELKNRTLLPSAVGGDRSGQGFILRLMLSSSDPEVVATYLPRTTANGEELPVEWGDWIFFTKPGEVKLQAAEGGFPHTAEKFLMVTRLRMSEVVNPGRFATFIYVPGNVRTESFGRRNGNPILVSRLNFWQRTGLLYPFVVLCMVALLGGLGYLGYLLNGR